MSRVSDMLEERINWHFFPSDSKQYAYAKADVLVDNDAECLRLVNLIDSSDYITRDYIKHFTWDSSYKGVIIKALEYIHKNVRSSKPKYASPPFPFILEYVKAGLNPDDLHISESKGTGIMTLLDYLYEVMEGPRPIDINYINRIYRIINNIPTDLIWHCIDYNKINRLLPAIEDFTDGIIECKQAGINAYMCMHNIEIKDVVDAVHKAVDYYEDDYKYEMFLPERYEGEKPRLPIVDRIMLTILDDTDIDYNAGVIFGTALLTIETMMGDDDTDALTVRSVLAFIESIADGLPMEYAMQAMQLVVVTED